jgi:predicted nicotinamide N-methyase
MNKPIIHQTPQEALTSYTTEKVFIEDFTFMLDRPTGIDQLWEHPTVREAYEEDEYIPYWSELWPAARMLAKILVRESWAEYEAKFGKPLHVLEVGCGLGLAGIAALAVGMKVTFTDIDSTAAQLAGRNARRNGFTNYDCMGLDFRAAPGDLKVPMILASDVLYEPRFIEPMVQFVNQTLLPGGICLIGDADRMSAKPFKHEVYKGGLHLETTPIRVGEPGGHRTKGTIYRITKQSNQGQVNEQKAL